MNTAYSRGMVNIHGQPWSPSKAAIEPKPKPKSDGPGEYHKGFRVVGVPPGAMEEAQKEHLRQYAKFEAGDSVEKEYRLPWNEGTWLARFKKKPIRSKAYEIPQAATDCKALAERAGWSHVDVVALSKKA